MQKKIVALAVAGLSTAAFAQTNVTIYGVADVSGQGLNQKNVKGAASNSGYDGANVFNVQSNSSLIGFKGTEDLGNGLKALFQFETGVNVAGQQTSANGAHPGGVAIAGAGGLWGGQRDTFLGLSSKYGTAMGGLISTPFRSSLTSFAVEPGATGSMTIEKQMGTQRYGTSNLAFSSAIRATAIAYAMPTMYGFNGSIAYTGSNNNGTTNATGLGNAGGEGVSASSATPQSVFGFNLGWTGYGVNVQGAFQQANNQFSTATTTNLTSNPNAIGDYTSYLIGAAYTGVPGLKVSAVYNRNTLGTNGANTLTTGGAGKITNNQLYTGVGYRWGNWEPTLSATWSSDVDGASVQQMGSRQWQLRTGYYLSKRTQVYGLISNLNNSANQNYTFGQQNSQVGAATNATGSNLFTYGMGMRTSF